METKKLFWAVPVSSAFFLSLASPALGVWPCITVALVPLFYFVSNPSFSIKRKVGVAYLTVFLFLLWQYQFFWHLLPLNWIGITNKTLSLCIVGILWIILSGINALSGILLVLPFTRFFVSRFSSLFFIFLWPVSELFRSFIYSLLVAGTGAGIGDHFQFGFLAYVFSSSNFFRSLAPILGVFGLSLIPALLAVLFLYAVTSARPLQKASLVLVIFCGLYLSPGIFFNDQVTSLVNVLVIQSRNPVLFGYTDQYFENVVREYQKKVAEGLLMHPDTDIVVLPENTYFLKGIMEREGLSVEEAVTEVLGTKKERLLIYGDYDTENRKTISVIAKNDGSTPLVLEKSLLMPLGEYQPYIIGWGARLLGKGAWFREVLEYRSSFAASTGQKTVATPWGKVAVAACSEILSADVYRSIAKENPALIVHEQRLAHFHGHLSVFKEFLAASQIKAAMLHTPILGSVDSSGFSYIINKDGEIVSLGKEESDYIFGSVTAHTTVAE